MMKQAAILVLLSLAAAVATQWLHPGAPSWYLVEAPLRSDEVNLAEVDQRWQGQVVWLDARPRDQFEKGHIPGAHLLNEQEFDTLVFENMKLLQHLQVEPKPVVVYCSGQSCKASHAVRDRLVTSSLVPENIYVLREGWPAWEAEGRPIEK